MARQKPDPRQPKKPLARRLVYWATVGVLWCGIGVALFVGYCALDLPKPTDLKAGWEAPAIIMAARDGTPLYSSGRQRGEWLERDVIPVSLVAAVVSTEDRRFYSHGPIDLQGVARAMVANLKAGGVVEGGSTITQQLAKNIFLTPARTIKRKVQEVLLAFWLEDKYTKDEILTFYLNRAYFGGGAYGADAASQLYFGHGARSLSLSESAELAALLKAPSRLNPHNNPDAAWARAREVLGNMVETGHITREYALSQKPPRITPHSTPGEARYFIDYVRAQLGDVLGDPTDDIFVRTTLDRDLQKAAEAAVQRTLAADGKAADAGQGALLAMSPDGAIRAMVGGRSYVESQFNRTVQAHRQTGSAFKLFVYLAALEAGLTPETEMRDSPVTLNGWTPDNYGGTYQGMMTLEEAFAHSVNSVAVKLSERINRTKVRDMARRLGIESPLTPHPSLALGVSALAMDEVTGAYAAVANGGYKVKPYGVLEVRTASGQQLYVGKPAKQERVLKPQDVEEMRRLLLVALHDGTGKAARIDPQMAAGKTGTSQDYRDAWFVGFTHDLVTAVWVGNDDNHPMKRVTGGGLPARIWGTFMKSAEKGQPVAPFMAIDTRADENVAVDEERDWKKSVFKKLFGG